MLGPRELSSASSLFSAYASLAGTAMIVRSVANDLLPEPVRSFIFSTFASLFRRRASTLTLVIEEFTGISPNQVYSASETYLCTKVSPNTERLRVSKPPQQKGLKITLDKYEKIVDDFHGVQFTWIFQSVESEKEDTRGRRPPESGSERRSFTLIFDKSHRDLVFNSYLPFILDRAKAMAEQAKPLKIFTLNSCYGGSTWDSVNFDHPATFETLAMDPDDKKAIIEDLDRFLRRKDFYRRVGKAWKRGYLLYGPPGTGKSSLVAAMANHLKFDVYDLQLANVFRDSDLRRLLLTTGNRSILVIEDIDCSVDFPKRGRGNRLNPFDPLDDCPQGKKSDFKSVQLTLSGLLNFIDGLWSSCGDERIIIFTTNHKDRIDPALLRPGRMDVHIHMSYCSFPAFKTLASNYLGLPSSTHHHLYGEIRDLIDDAAVAPAQIAEEMMKSDDPDVALHGVVKILKRKRLEGQGEGNDQGAYEKGDDDQDEKRVLRGRGRPKRSCVKMARRRKFSNH